MASGIKVTKSTRLVELLKGEKVGGPALDKALFDIGTLVRNDAIGNITRRKIVDEGFLRANVSFKLEKSAGVSRVVVGAFGVKYGRMVEYGGAFTDRQRRAMFASLREQGKLEKNYKPKGVIVGNVYRARPFLNPAVDKNYKAIKGIIRSAVIKR